MDGILALMIAIVGGFSTLGMVKILWYFHDKENKK